MATKTLLLPPPTCAPALLNANATDKKLYWDRSHYDSPDAQTRALSHSSTVYVGNLAFSTRSIHLRRHFQQGLGPVSSVHVGLDRYKKTPCGFAFVEFRHRMDALSAVGILTGSKLDGRVIRVELDAGFKPGRQYGRGASGGQVRDDRGGGSGRERRISGGGANAAGAAAGGNGGEKSPTTANKPRWEPPSATAKTDDASHYGPGDDTITSQLGEKRGRDEAMEQDNGDNPSTKNPRIWDYDTDDDDEDHM